ncbi:S9 family peptidase [Fibrisoma montanum]|uniref:S9 family peptidase n=2 Tax=Fibrisoma montanum TaxID=2305895 RepID=A0A418MEV2_9BACT|nr:S9 family peptidase [Fibrisoma montanum]
MNRMWMQRNAGGGCLLTILFLLCQPGIGWAQKKPLDGSAYQCWQGFTERKISADGNWFLYGVAPSEGDPELVVQSFDGRQKQLIRRGHRATFMPDSRHLLFYLKAPYAAPAAGSSARPDTVGLLALGTQQLTLIPGVKAIRHPELSGRWLAYTQTPPTLLASAQPTATSAAQPTTNSSSLVLLDTQTGQSRTFEGVTDFVFSKQGEALVMNVASGQNPALADVIWMNLNRNAIDTVARNLSQLQQLTLDAWATQLAFLAQANDPAKTLALWYYKAGAETAQIVTTPQTTGIQPGYVVGEAGGLRFSTSGNRLYFGVSRPRPAAKPMGADQPKLTLWHYQDDYLQPQQLKQLDQEAKRTYLAILHLTDRRVVQLGDIDLEDIILPNDGDSDYVLGVTTKGGRVEADWLEQPGRTAYRVAVNDGSRTLIREKLTAPFSISPKGQYALWYDSNLRHYVACQLATGLVRNISAAVSEPLFDTSYQAPGDPQPFGVAIWEENDRSVLVHTEFDIWQLDPLGKVPPANLTRGRGRTSQTILHYADINSTDNYIRSGDELILSAFNRTTKYAGFYRLRFGRAEPPAELTMGPYSYSFPGMSKAKNANRYVVSRGNVNEYNLYTTTDIRQFRKVSDLNPQQKDYNWLTTELVQWKQPDGMPNEGLLLKPENFDPQKKYPVLVWFYEKDSDGLYAYRTPSPSGAILDMPMFVSNGYLLFIPNIQYTNGEPGESACRSVLSGLDHLAQYSWVDTSRMGVQSHSWGGYQVSYLISRTNRFKAASAGAVVSNMVSAYGSLRRRSGGSRQWIYERSQSRLGATLWEKPELYIANSPIFRADKIQTPLLLVHNDGDGQVPVEQSIELYMALRRLQKPVWLLQYEGEDHVMRNLSNRRDLSRRFQTYFDHYLKGAPMPPWLRDGMPAVLKNTSSAY